MTAGTAHALCFYVMQAFMASSFLLFSLPAEDFPAKPHVWPQFVHNEYDQRRYHVRPPEPIFRSRIYSTEYGAATSSTVTSRQGCDLKGCDYSHHPSGHGSVMTAGTAHALRFYVTQQSLTEGSLPSHWMVGKVVPFHKSGNKHSPLNIQFRLLVFRVRFLSTFCIHI
ncbi:uncharacterized protein LOC142796289 [Rhipicephalus microplus]|uniref:uncharacterized protein LOC142796289 n=1 Tax=Rhipicephalus microplus TaxID=6941 RepID=UPI003F6B78CB